ncbi:MAG: ATP-dependent zinc metalloprotease FtsH [Chloroflexi bacterium]|nr:ATP-dependent zinc metalloprotease FtsH [Chloroflexota bacterium]MBU1750173.1 ATP-dependent zinc metalloprotease FtsH [Chloroflexota bacterium]
MFRNTFVWLILAVALGALLLTTFNPFGNGPAEVPISEVLNVIAKDVQEGKEPPPKITIINDIVEAETSQGTLHSTKELGSDFLQMLHDRGIRDDQITVQIQRPNDLLHWLEILSPYLIMLVMVGGLFFLIRQAQSGNNQAMMFGKSRARMFAGDKPTVTFADVAGVEEAKHELEEVVEFLKEPTKFTALGARIPRGVLVMGPPGTGKTLLARAVAGEAGVPFFHISGSEFVEMFVGVGASRVRDLFDQAKRNAPCIVFVDEIDAVGRQRGAGLGGSHDEREQTLNQILVEMDGFDTNTNVIVIAATNRPDILDPALLRPGRFDRRVILDRPDMNGRRAIFEVHVRGKPLDDDVDLLKLAQQTPGLSGADIANVVNEAAILAARENKKSVNMGDFQESVEKVVAGPERRSRLISEEEKRIIAYHEAGHALVSHLLPLADPVHKISIVSRGMALGYTMSLPEEDRYLTSSAKFRDELAALLGGHASEKLVFGDTTTGSSNDLERATKMARQMVTRLGMSDKLGPLTFGQKEELIFLGREISEQRDYSELVAQEIDHEVQSLVREAYDRATETLTTNRDKLELLARRLIEHETLEEDEFLAVLSEPTASPGLGSGVLGPIAI